MKRQFLTRSESNRRLILFAIVAILIDYCLSGLNNVLSGGIMGLIWMGGGFAVAAVMVATERLKSRRQE